MAGGPIVWQAEGHIHTYIHTYVHKYITDKHHDTHVVHEQVHRTNHMHTPLWHRALVDVVQAPARRVETGHGTVAETEVGTETGAETEKVILLVLQMVACQE